MRRGARATRRGFGATSASLFALVVAYAAGQGKPLWNADFVILDTGNVRSFVSWTNAAHVLDQPTAGLQVAAPTPSALFNNKLAVTPTAAGTRYPSNQASSYWRYCHDGTGCTILHVFAAVNVAAIQALSTTSRNNAAVTGHNFYFSSGASQPRALTRNAAATVMSAAAAATGFGVGTYSTQDFSAGVEAAQYTKSARTAGAYTPPAATGDPDRAFSLFNGDTSISDFWFQGSWRMSAPTGLWGVADRDLWQRYIFADSGIAA